MARSKKRRGQRRKRKALPRTASGQLSRSAERRVIERMRDEHETRQSMAELHASRARALGLTDDQGKHHLSETIAGRMALKGVLSFPQAQAIDEYAKVVRRAAAAMLAPAPPRCSLSPPTGGGYHEDQETYDTIMRRYNDAFGVIREVGVRACRAINIIVRDLCDLPLSERECARAAAQALVRHFGFDERVAA